MSIVFHFLYKGKITDKPAIPPYDTSEIICTILSKTDTILSSWLLIAKSRAIRCYLTTILASPTK